MDAALLSRIDLPQLAIHSGANEVGLRRLLRQYLESAEDCLLQMEQAAITNNILSWNHALQEMKAASSAITARRLAGLCSEAEIIRSFPHEQTQSMLYHLHKELVILRRAVDAFVSDPAEPR